MRILPLFCLMLLIFSSCSVTRPNQDLNPALIAGNLKYLPRPLESDSVSSKTYITTNYIRFDELNENDISGGGGELSISRAHVFKNFNIAYGGSVSNGKITYKTFDNLGKFVSKNKTSFSAILLQTSIQGVIADGDSEYRYLGLDLGYSKELGDYKIIRNKLKGDESYTVIPNTGLFTAGFSTEVTIRKNHLVGSLRVSIGRNFGNLLAFKGPEISKPSRVVGSFAIFARYKEIFAVVDYGTNFGRIGLGFSF